MFRKPPSKLEQLQDTVVHALDELRDAVADLPADRASKIAAEKLRAADQKRQQLGALAAERTETLRTRAGEAAHATAGVVSHGAHNIAQTAQHATHAAGGAISGAASTVAGAASSVAGAVTGAAGAIGSAAGAIGSAAGNVAHSATDRLHSLRGHATETANEQAENAHDAAQNAKAVAKAAAKAHAARAQNAKARARNSVELPAAIEVREEDSSSRWLWIVVGVLAGAAIMLLFAPGGRRRRALLTDKASDISRRAAGAIHERTAKGTDDADDITIADRVRTALGSAPATRDMERLNVDCADGLVTLRGPIADAALQSEIEAIVRSVKGVREVQLDLLLDESDNDSPTFVG